MRESKRLREFINEKFSKRELEAICFDLKVDVEQLESNTKNELVISLIRYLQQRNRLHELVTEINRQRPGFDVPTPSNLFIDTFASSKWRIILSIVILLILVTAAIVWWVANQRSSWATNQPIEESKIGIAIAEFAESVECKKGDIEASELIFQAIEKELRESGFANRVQLTKIALICDRESAEFEGRQLNAEIVLWGWIPASIGGINSQFTLVGEPATPEAINSLAESLKLLVSTPGQERFYQLSGRTEALVRFVFGLLYAQEEDWEDAIDMFDRGIAELEEDRQGQELAETLAVFHTEKGLVLIQEDRLPDAFDAYTIAEGFNKDYLRLQIALAQYYYLHRNWAEAEIYLEKAYRQDEANPRIEYGFGLLAYYQDNFDKAIIHYNYAIRLTMINKGEPILAYLARGYAYKDSARCKQAIVDFQTIIESSADEATVALKSAAEQEIESCIRNVILTKTPAPLTLSTSTLPPTTMPTLLPTWTATPISTVEPILTSTPFDDSKILCVLSDVIVSGFSSVNVRRGPGISYPSFTYLTEGGVVCVIGRDSSGDWLNVILADGQSGWIFTSGTNLEDSMLSQEIPIAGTIPASPTPASPIPATITPSTTPNPMNTPRPEPASSPSPTRTLLPPPTQTPSPPLTPTGTLLPLPSPTITLSPPPSYP